MSMRLASLPVALFLAACSFSPSGGGGTAIDSGSDGPTIDSPVDSSIDTVDAPTDAAIDTMTMIDACVDVCDPATGTISSCGQPVQTCAAGCSSTGTVHCRQIIASNGVSTLDVTDADTVVTLMDNRLYLINTDTGEIRHFALDGSGGQNFRPGTTGLDATTKIRYRNTAAVAGVPGMGVLGLRGLSIPAGTVVRGVGDRTLVIVASEGINVAGKIDVSAGRQRAANGAVALFEQGPGGGRGALDIATAAGGCAAGGPGFEGAGDDTGGGGGGLGTAGAVGGTSGGHAGGTATGMGQLAVSCAQVNLVPLRGGSGGGAGGQSNADGGGGGGALQLTSLGGAITLSGKLFAGGAGGANGGAGQGGAGGGAGGALLIEAGTITVTGSSLTAGGGAGGSGDGGGAGESAHDDGTAAQAATGGNGGRGATGANAGNGEALATAGTGNGDGTGGGGGGAGIIHLRSLMAPNQATATVIRPSAGTSMPLRTD